MRTGKIGYKHVQVVIKGDATHYYFRKPNCERCRLDGTPGTEAFDRSYAAALARGPKKIASPTERPTAGTVAALVWDYRASLAFSDRPASVRTPWNRVYDKLVANIGDKEIAFFNRDCVTDILKGIAHKPAKRNETRRAYMDLFAWALAQVDPKNPGRNAYGLMANPMAGIKKLRPRNPEGFHTLTPAEVAKYRDRHPEGTVARAAFELMFWEGFRASDARTVGPEAIRGGQWDFIQVKNGGTEKQFHRRGTVRPEVVAILQRTPVPGMSGVMAWDLKAGPFLRTEQGEAFGRGGFGRAMRRWFDLAGLLHCTAHGVRKRCGNDLAEARASDSEISAVLGHKDHASAKPYTAKAQGGLLADNGHKARAEYLAQNVKTEGDADLATLLRLAATMGLALVPATAVTGGAESRQNVPVVNFQPAN